MLSKIKTLKNKYQYKECRELIEKSAKTPKLLLALAECYYKDNELYYKFSYKKALEILENEEDFKNASDEEKKERLNLIGAVYKRLWEREGKIKDLLKAIENYKKAWDEFREFDRGYGGCNAANLYQILGELLDDDNYKQKANNLRKEIVDFLRNKKLNKWDYHTLVTINYALKNFDELKHLIEFIKSDDEWEKFTTYESCYKIDSNDIEIMDNLFNQKIYYSKKVGLALSGGGFRASLFHLGTLSALAEADKLKDIEVISTVSGGSIIGVFYYLKVKELLESKKDEEITQRDYLRLVNELIDEFLGIITTRNLRNEVFVEFHNINEFIDFYLPFSDFTRTKKIAKLYDKYFYSKFSVKYLKDLIIIPKGYKSFKPHFENFKRKNKVPILVINSTNLNNGHNFQFHATKMGEVSSEFDKNFKIPFLRSGCDVFDKFLISESVAASSCVPGIFPALKVNLQNITLNLVDGGVYENIGLNALFSENVEEFIISDAGYEMDNIKNLDFNYNLKILGISKYLKRTVDVLMDINKDLNYEKIIQEKITNILADERIKFEIDCDEKKFDEQDNFYSLFSKIRTDLDRFSEIEAKAIIYFGYKKMKEKLDTTYEYDFSFKDIEMMWESIELKEIIKKAGNRKVWR